MNGLERMDKPRRWPLVFGLGLVGVIVAGLAGWSYFQQGNSQLQDAAGTPSTGSAGSPQAGSGRATAATEESASLPVVTAACPELVEGVSAVESASVAKAMEARVVSGQVAAADTLLAAGKKDLAREKYYEALAAGPEASLKAAIETKLGQLNVEMIRLPWPMAEKQEVVVQANDAVKLIARKSGTTVEMIVKGNELKRPDIIQPGQRLKVFAGKLEMVVSKSRHDLLLTANGRFFKRYQVATGRYEKTPVGTFAVVDRIPEPPWHRDDGKVIPFGDKENILGTRWLAIKATGSTPEIKGYGIHGTWDNASIGKSESAGCIRLKNEDVEELFEMVPVGTSVVIVD
jgi:lipoprotein-anchoring transpeptidase ErfK/SrfK